MVGGEGWVGCDRDGEGTWEVGDVVGEVVVEAWRMGWRVGCGCGIVAVEMVGLRW